MNLSAIYHKSCDNMCYALDEDNVVITIRTGKDIDKVIIHSGDPYTSGTMGGCNTWYGDPTEMTERVELPDYFLWSVTIKPPFKRLKYYFEVFSKKESTYYIESGFRTKKEMFICTGEREDFQFPWLNPSDVYKAPAWVNDTIWYQIFPERFCNGNPDISPKGTKAWPKKSSKITFWDKFGGDIEGITSKLDYIKNLGISGIYLTPINTAPSTHKYDTADYYEIDPHFGDIETVQNFVSEAHKRGIRIMFDGVFNHCGTMFSKWQDVLEKGPDSKYFNWFMINKWPLLESKLYKPVNSLNGVYYTFGFFDSMPKLNTNNPEVIDYFLDVCTYWVKTFDIDAIRLDVANEVSHTFCKALRQRLLSLKPDFYLLGEIWHDATQWLRGDEFDSVMNYPFSESANEFWLKPDSTKESLQYSINRCYSLYPKQVNNILFNLLDSHDTARLINRLKGNLDKLYQLLVLLFTMPGTVCIYYGTEIALDGGHDPDCRRPMPWAAIEAGKYNDRIDMIKKLISLRNDNKVFKSDKYSFTNISDDNRIVSYTKTYQDTTIEIVLNCSKSILTYTVDSDDILFANLYDNKTLKPDGALVVLKK
ncbi:MAG: alpha-glycosidase [Lachnospiraceae bacterium]|nr:alpha-glycosidase [Lachnospiraceae bacterium]